ncbi:methyl-accepting chemotaxis protein [Nitratidesulfovibrio termitidis]|uniref:methyl-accepting chemotaxis protein n=1 Tax=Nitratidesulfovibrio termitidis TaxID=42252 RepID=UPI00040B4979|nr:methyl-accepting chemotaxis protein [Nitratidesulfovibrio termitidis]
MRFKSISTQITVLTGGLVIFFMCAFVFIASKTAYDGTLRSETANMAQVGQQIEKVAEDFVTGNLTAVRGLTQQKALASGVLYGSASLVMKDQLQQTLKGNPHYAAIHAFDATGKVLYGYTEDGQDISGKPLGMPDVLAAVSVGKEFIGTTPFKGAKGDVLFTVAAPVLNVMGQSGGGIAITLDWTSFSARFIESVKFGQHGYPFVLDGSGRFLSHPNKELLLSDASQHDFARVVLAQQTAQMEYPWEGKLKILVSRTMPITGWKICSSAYEDDLAGVARQQRLLLAIMGLVAMVAMTGSIVLLTRRVILSPMNRIRQFAGQVAQGDLRAVMDGAYRYELDDLARSIQSMVADLKEKLGFSQSVLEAMVVPVLIVDREERTVFTNKACMDMLEIDTDPKAQYGRTLAEVFYNEPGRKTAVGRAMNEKTSIKNLEVVIAGHKGGKVDVLANVTYLQDLDGNVIGGFCLYIDTTEMKRQAAIIAEQNERIARASAEADDVASQLATASEELSAQIEQSARGSDIQRERTAEAATAMEEMNASVLEVARNAGGAAEMAEKAKARAQEGAEVVDGSVRTIQHAHDLASHLKADMAELGTQAQGIGQIMNVIADIADQTNLLALNAAIEAARAGDAGRGFAVVADEVRKLAEKTMTATNEVGSAIRGIQESARKNIDNTEKATAAIEEGTGMARRSGDVLREIVGLVESTADQVRSIATASEQQSAASEEINRSTDEITRIAAETAEAMRHSAQAVEDVSRLASDLKRVIGDMRS